MKCVLLLTCPIQKHKHKYVVNSLTVCLTKATSVSVVIIVCSYIVWGPVRDVKISLALQHLIFQTFLHVLFELRMKNMQFETNLPWMIRVYIIKLDQTIKSFTAFQLILTGQQ